MLGKTGFIGTSVSCPGNRLGSPAETGSNTQISVLAFLSSSDRRSAYKLGMSLTYLRHMSVKVSWKSKRPQFSNNSAVARRTVAVGVRRRHGCVCWGLRIRHSPAAAAVSVPSIRALDMISSAVSMAAASLFRTAVVLFVSSFTADSCLFDSVCSSAAADVTSLERSLMALSSSRLPWAFSMVLVVSWRTSATLAQCVARVDRITDMLASRESLADLASAADDPNSLMAGETSGRMDSSLLRWVCISVSLRSISSVFFWIESSRSRSFSRDLQKPSPRAGAAASRPIPLRANGAAAIPSPPAATAPPPNHAAVALVAAAPDKPLIAAPVDAVPRDPTATQAAAGTPMPAATAPAPPRTAALSPPTAALARVGASNGYHPG